MMATVLVLLDAFRHDYLTAQTTPFLWDCRTKGEWYERVVPSFGFCERAEVLSGRSSQQARLLTAVGYDPKRSPYRLQQGLRWWQPCERLLVGAMRCGGRRLAERGQRVLRRWTNSWYRRRGVAMSTFRIPLPWLRFFALTEDFYDHRRRGGLAGGSVLEQLSESGRSYFYDAFTALNFPSPYRGDQQRLEGTVEEARRRRHDLYLVYVSAPDSVGHRFGPETGELRGAIRRLDHQLREFVAAMEGQGGPHRYVLLGDHGMLRVRHRIDVESALRRLLKRAGLRPVRDYLYFLDSTMVRLWAHSGRARRLLPELIADCQPLAEHGTLVGAEQAACWGLPWPDRQYGDLLWVADPGVLVFPDFFHRHVPCAGMHGYDPLLPDSQGMCLHWGPEIAVQQTAKLPLRDTYQLLTRSLAL